MRHVLCAAAAALAFALVPAPVQAQGLTNFFPSGTHVSAFGSGGAHTVINTPIDTSLSIVPFTGPGQGQGATSFLPGFFRNISFPGFPSGPGVSPLPSPASFPTYPNARSVPFVPVNKAQPDANPIQRLLHREQASQ